MGLFNFNSSSETTDKPQGESMDFVTQINVGDRDLSKPYIDDRMVGYMGMVYFGEDNLFPNLTNNLYLSSPIHATCINFKTSAICGAGYEFKGYDQLKLDRKKEIKLFEKRVKFHELIKTVTKNYVKHNRAHILLKYNQKEKRYVDAKLIDPEKVRNDQVTIFKDVTRYFVSDGFEQHHQIKMITPYSPTNKEEWQMLELRGETGGSPTYPLPDYVSNGNWAYLDGEISYLYKQGIVNSINPSMIFKFPFDTNPETKAKIKRMLTTMGKGAKNMGRILTFFKPKPQQPEIETIATTQNDKLYKQVSQEIKDNIAISHQMNPSLAGVVTAGKLSNDSETKTYYQLFEKNWVTENRDIVEDFLNDLCRIFGLTERLELNRFNIVDDEIVEVDGDSNRSTAPSSSEDKEADARAQLRGSVGGVQGIIQIQQSVAQGLTDRGSAAALLELIYGFSKSDALRLLGDVKEGSQPAPQKEGESQDKPNEDVDLSVNVNDNLKGLSAKENMDLMRIIREYKKGKLIAPLARTRLAAYGLDESVIDEILNNEE